MAKNKYRVVRVCCGYTDLKRYGNNPDKIIRMMIERYGPCWNDWREKEITSFKVYERNGEYPYGKRHLVNWKEIKKISYNDFMKEQKEKEEKQNG